MVIAPEMTSSSFRKSARAARGRPQFATWREPPSSQRYLYSPAVTLPAHRSPEVSACVSHSITNSATPERSWCLLKKYSRAAGDRSQWTNVDAMVGNEWEELCVLDAVQVDSSP